MHGRSSTRTARFQPVELTPIRLDQFHDYTHAALAQTIQEFVRLGGKPINAARWCLHRSRGGVSAYTDRRPLDARLSSLLVAGIIRSRLDDVLEGLYMDSNEATRLVHSQLSARFVDAEVLKVMEQRSIDRPFAFTGIKWAMLKFSSSGVASNRDICVFEKLGTIDIADGRKLGYFIVQSIDIPECPPSRSRRVVRANISLCYLFEELKDGVVGVYMRGSMESYGPQALWKMARNSFADLAVSVSNVVAIALAKSIICEVCHTLPSFFDHHQECAGCNKVSVCRKCRAKCDVFDCDQNAQRLVTATFCIDCVRNVRSPHTRADEQPKRKPAAPPQRHTTVVPRIHEPIHQKPIYRVSARASQDSEHMRFDIPEFDSYVNSFNTVTEDESSGEHVPDSQRSLREFSLKLAQQIEDAGYSDSDVCLRLTDLTTLGAGSIQHDHATRDGDEEDPSGHSKATNPAATSPTSSGYSVGADEESDDDHGGGLQTFDHEETISIRPLRRSTQPPEMLERQTLNRDGSFRIRPHARSFSEPAPTHANERAKLMSRLVQASITAEQTFRLTREQSWRANHIFVACQGRAAEQ